MRWRRMWGGLLGGEWYVERTLKLEGVVDFLTKGIGSRTWICGY